MKFKLPYITLVAAALLLSSCKETLTLNPTTSVADSEIYKTTKNVQTVINGTWRYLNDTYFTFANPGYSAVMRTSDAMGNDIAVTTKYGYNAAYSFTEMYDIRNYRVNSFWTLFYKVIDNANNVIQKGEGAEGPDTEKNINKGQAKVLRAFAYLNLASYYQFSYQKDKKALSVPIYTEPTTTSTQGRPRATLEDLYTLIITDLEDATQLLKDYKRSNTEKYKINAQVAQGLLARAYLLTGEWEKAALAAEKAENGYALMTESAYQDGFNDLLNSEWIWGHLQTTDQSTASYTFHYLDVSSSVSYYFSFMADPYFKNYFDANDVRTKLFEWDTNPGREGYLRYKKFRFKPTNIGDIVYMRSAEMVLIEAEGYARAGKTDKAVAALNRLRSARKASLYDATAAKDLLQEILLERRKELWGEGFSLWDIIRTQGKVSRKQYLNPDGTPIKVSVTLADGSVKVLDGQGHRVVKFPNGKDFSENSDYYLFAIPFAEREQNPNL
ncbi:RagB/SusD family nutrient uptake outer membrane protein [Sphingobacterium sp. Mn56C]|uniref:RagB/SusD family nutrient uptake outer membrane protein n=1 Tax=Sphingobacterium sp. Mn56C TaxID=3395261 RepID=UPI003BE6F86A